VPVVPGLVREVGVPDGLEKAQVLHAGPLEAVAADDAHVHDLAVAAGDGGPGPGAGAGLELNAVVLGAGDDDVLVGVVGHGGEFGGVQVAVQRHPVAVWGPGVRGGHPSEAARGASTVSGGRGE